MALAYLGLHAFREGLGDAHLGGHGRGDLGRRAPIGREQVLEQLEAFLAGRPAVALERAVRGRDGCVYVGFRPGGDLSHLFLGSRVDDRYPAAGLDRVDPPSVDVELRLVAHVIVSSCRASPGRPGAGRAPYSTFLRFPGPSGLRRSRSRWAGSPPGSTRSQGRAACGRGRDRSARRRTNVPHKPRWAKTTMPAASAPMRIRYHVP